MLRGTRCLSKLIMLSRKRDEFMKAWKTTREKEGTNLAGRADPRKVREKGEFKNTRDWKHTCMGGRESSTKDKKDSNHRSRLENSKVHI